MKIIGQTKDGFILEAGENEVARLVGYYGQYDCRGKLVVGADIQVNAMFDQLYKIKSLKQTVKKLEEGASELLESIRTKNPVLEPVVAAIESTTPKN